MSKSSSNAPRFTQSTPPASKAIGSRAPVAKSSIPTRGPATSSGAGIETPAQKVARLRAAHQAKRLAQISTWDKVVVRGRDIADTAHRWTVMGIVAVSIVMIGVTSFTIADMIRYNRQKKKEFYETQSEMLKKRFMDALEAEGQGVATEDQILLLQEERAVAAAAEAKKEEPGIWKSITNRFKRTLDLNLSKEDVSYLDRRRTILDRIEEQEKKAGVGTNTHTISSTLQVVQEKRREVEKHLEDQGRSGPLDQLADEAVTKAENTRKSWFSW